MEPKGRIGILLRGNPRESIIAIREFLENEEMTDGCRDLWMQVLEKLESGDYGWNPSDEGEAMGL